MSRPSRNIPVVWGPHHKWLIDGSKDGDEYGWKDLVGSFTTGKVAGANVPTFSTFRDGISAYSFSAGTMNEIWLVFHVNHDIIEGQLCYPHIHWSPGVSTGTGTVRWGIEYIFQKGHNQAAFPASTTIYLEDTVSADDQYGHRIIEASDAQAFAMPEVDSVILCRVFRDAAHANDTFADEAFGLTLDFHYRAGKFATKGKRPDFDKAD